MPKNVLLPHEWTLGARINDLIGVRYNKIEDCAKVKRRSCKASKIGVDGIKLSSRMKP